MQYVGRFLKLYNLKTCGQSVREMESKMLTPSEIRFINSGFFILDNMDSGDDIAIVDPIQGIYIKLTGDEIASLITNLLDKFHTLKT
jgi:hypothetical protein